MSVADDLLPPYTWTPVPGARSPLEGAVLEISQQRRLAFVRLLSRD